MKFLQEKDLTASIVGSKYYMDVIEIDKHSTKELVKKIGEANKDAEALSVLNLMGQKLEYIDTLRYEYKHFGKTLAFSELCRGEQVFLVSYAAKISGETLYLYYDMSQLTKTNLRNWYKEFKDCNNIIIIYASTSELNCLKMIMTGEI